MGCLQAHPHPPLQRCDGRVREGPQPTKFTPKRPNRPPPPPPPPSPPPASSRAHNRNRGKRHRTDATTPANKKQKQEHENESEQAQQPLPTQQGTNVKDKEDVFDGEFGLARERLLEVVDPAGLIAAYKSKRHEQLEYKTAWTAIGNFRCGGCGRVFPRLSELKAHQDRLVDCDEASRNLMNYHVVPTGSVCGCLGDQGTWNAGGIRGCGGKNCVRYFSCIGALINHVGLVAVHRLMEEQARRSNDDCSEDPLVPFVAGVHCCPGTCVEGSDCVYRSNTDKALVGILRVRSHLNDSLYRYCALRTVLTAIVDTLASLSNHQGLSEVRQRALTIRTRLDRAALDSIRRSAEWLLENPPQSLRETVGMLLKSLGLPYESSGRFIPIQPCRWCKTNLVSSFRLSVMMCTPCWDRVKEIRFIADGNVLVNRNPTRPYQVSEIPCEKCGALESAHFKDIEGVFLCHSCKLAEKKLVVVRIPGVCSNPACDNVESIVWKSSAHFVEDVCQPCYNHHDRKKVSKNFGLRNLKENSSVGLRIKSAEKSAKGVVDESVLKNLPAPVRTKQDVVDKRTSGQPQGPYESRDRPQFTPEQAYARQLAAEQRFPNFEFNKVVLQAWLDRKKLEIKASKSAAMESRPSAVESGAVPSGFKV